jgi:hypothetical protein
MTRGVQPCPSAKRATGRLRKVGEAEYTCTPSCGQCHGYAWTRECAPCQGCGLVLGVICEGCRGLGRVPAKPVRSEA